MGAGAAGAPPLTRAAPGWAGRGGGLPGAWAAEVLAPRAVAHTPGPPAAGPAGAGAPRTGPARRSRRPGACVSQREEGRVLGAGPAGRRGRQPRVFLPQNTDAWNLRRSERNTPDRVPVSAFPAPSPPTPAV